MMPPKRKRATRAEQIPDAELSQDEIAAPTSVATPTKRATQRNGASSPASAARKRAAEDVTTPTAKRTLAIHSGKEAPVTPDRTTTPARKAADKSAKRKSNKKLLERTIAAGGSEDGADEDEQLADEIADDDDDGDGEQDAETAGGDVETLVKRGRGRPKGSKNREPTPPTDLPAYEWYFWINRPKGLTTSSNTFPASAFLSHSTYHESTQKYQDPHVECIEHLHNHHRGNFAFWEFEMSQGFNIVLHGYGNKLGLLKQWADWLHAKHEAQLDQASALQGILQATPAKGRKGAKSCQPESEAVVPDVPGPVTIVMEAHHPALTTRTLFSMIARAALPEDVALYIPNQPTDALKWLLAQLDETSTATSPPIYLLISPIHASLLTHAPMPTLLAQLSQHPRIHILAAADDPHFPLLWPQGLKDQYNWVFHDGSTFASYDDGRGQVAGVGVVDTVNELLGRKGARGKGREGVRWVLRSLPENARGVYRILVAEILSAEGDEVANMDLDMDEIMPEDEDEEMGDDGDEFGGSSARRKAASAARNELPAYSYKMLYSKAVEEFLCSSEMAFRGLLKEFVDHQMVTIKRDSSGQEAIGIDMRRDELEGVLEDLMLAE